ncbi:MAG: DUF4412 domain-containing protein [Acidobacteriota bacterium]
MRQAESGRDGNLVLSGMVVDVGEVRPHRQTREIGYACKEWVITAGEKDRIEAWAATDIPRPLTFRSARRVSTAMMGPMAGPLATTTVVKVMGMKVDATSETAEVERGPVPTEVFEIPAQYEQKKSSFAR